MADNSKIEWTDATFNPWIGCTKVSPACDHCYAEVSTPSRTRSVEWGAGKPRQRTSPGNWNLPLRWNRQPFAQCSDCGWRGEWPKTDAGNRGACPACDEGALVGARRRVFCASLADWLDNEVPVEWLADLLDLIRRTPNLDWLLLTKRIGNWEARLTAAHQHVVKTMGGGTAEYRDRPLWALGMWIQDWLASKAPANVWIGATICNQAEAERDIPKLLRVPAAVRFLSIEPMLGPIDFYKASAAWSNTNHPWRGTPILHGIDWIICGGESGAKAKETRMLHPEWARVLRDQCARGGVAFLFKQWGNWYPIDAWQPWDRSPQDAIRVDGSKIDPEEWHDDGQRFKFIDKKLAGRQLDGIEHNGYPKGMRHG